MDCPFITIVMPVYNEGRFIEQTIRQLLEQDYPADRYEILVADGMSTDNTREIVQALASQHPQIRLLDNPKRKSSSGRNVGFQNGRGDYFLVVDGHCYIPNNQLLKDVVDCFKISGADCLGRPQPLDPPGLSPFQQAVALARRSKLGHGSDSLIYSDYEGFSSPVSNGAVYTRHIFEKVGYVDEQFDACEDVEFNHRLENSGIKTYTSPKLRIKYFPRETLAGLFKQMTRYGAGRFKFCCKHPETLSLNTLVPPIFTLTVLASIPGILGAYFDLLPFFLGCLLSFIIAAYICLLLAQSTIILLDEKKINCCYLPIIFFIIHFGLGWGFLGSLKSFFSKNRLHRVAVR